MNHVQDPVDNRSEEPLPELSEDDPDLRPHVSRQRRGVPILDSFQGPSGVDRNRESEVEGYVDGSDVRQMSRGAEVDPARARGVDMEEAEDAEIPAGLERPGRHLVDVRPVDVRCGSVPGDGHRVPEVYPQIPHLRTEGVPRVGISEPRDPENRWGLPDLDRLFPHPVSLLRDRPIPRPELEGTLWSRDEDLRILEIVGGGERAPEGAHEVGHVH